MIPVIQGLKKMVVISEMFQIVKNIQSYKNNSNFGISEFDSMKICLYEEPHYLFARVHGQQCTQHLGVYFHVIRKYFLHLIKTVGGRGKTPCVTQLFHTSLKATKGYHADDVQIRISQN